MWKKLIYVPLRDELAKENNHVQHDTLLDEEICVIPESARLL